MEDKNKRDLYLKVRVSQEEMEAIKRSFTTAGWIHSADLFVR